MGSSIRFVTHNRHGDPSDVIQPGYGMPFMDSLHHKRLTLWESLKTSYVTVLSSTPRPGDEG